MTSARRILGIRRVLLALMVLGVLAQPLAAAGVRANLDANTVDFEVDASYRSVTVRVSGQGHIAEQIFGADEALVFSPAEHGLPDGSYTFEATVNVERPDVRTDGAPEITERIAAFGYFTLEAGAIVDRGSEEPIASISAPAAGNDGIQTVTSRDQVISDDLIVDGSICAGLDCVNGESFGFDTLRLKENNLRIKAQDTSNSASFPSNDWQITFNDSSNGGATKFSIDDIDGGRTPFTIEAGAPSHSLYVDDGGRMGFGTATPVVEMHVVDGDTPTLRLEQDGSSGFTPQTWDVAGNETNFFVRDATNGSRLPFKIRPSAPTNSLYVDTDGDVGLGTASPTAALDVTRSNGGAAIFVRETSSTTSFRNLLELTNNGGVGFVLDNTSTAGVEDEVFISVNNPGTAFTINFNDSAGTEFSLSAAGDLTLEGQIFTEVGASCNAGCDAVFSPEFDLPTIQEHADLMYAKSHLPAVGPTGPNMTVNLTQKTMGMLHELEKAHIYIHQLSEQMEEKNDVIESLVERIAALEQRLQQD